MSNREVVDRYVRALVGDLDTTYALQHPDFVEDFPQSGERIRGRDNFRKIHESYPGGLPESKALRVVGSEDRWVATPMYTPLRIEGSGDVYTFVAVANYPDGKTWYATAIVELKDSLIFRMTTFFAEPFEAPEWRAKWVESITD